MIKFYEQELQIEEAVEHWTTDTLKRGAAPESAQHTGYRRCSLVQGCIIVPPRRAVKRSVPLCGPLTIARTRTLPFSRIPYKKPPDTMTSRMHAPHTTCPGCREEVYLEELVKGRCPLCGCEFEEFDTQDTEIEDYVDRSDLPWLVFNYFLFKRFLEIGASPVQIMQFV
ncbi:MAG TPA: hypothetical protein PLW73_08805, partial [Methanoregulaceae archaeon]|nr:hypothetical protein [Methanoregulaceae archaeon]